MINFLHTFQPSRVLFELGPLTVYWYGFLYMVALAVGLFVTRWIARKRGIATPWLFDIALWMFLGGIAGARLWYVLLIEPLHFFSYPFEVVAFWNGGLAIHGGIIGAVLVLWFWTKRHGLNPLSLADLFAPALALGQAIGRWGNYFNQELHGGLTNLPWGIPVEFGNASAGVSAVAYVHPTFLYESFLDLILFGLLAWFVLRVPRPGRVAAMYIAGYAVIRFVV
ncbi:MAG: prolipoprotein diacylglyceryl transferase, partial [bacterium]|nr:prolipoprotein diacylglyceryl transferase [bacterium]